MTEENPIVYVRPAKGATIRQPDRGYSIMPAEGGFVSKDDMYYMRLIMSGDIIVGEEPKPKSEAPRGDKSKSK